MEPEGALTTAFTFVGRGNWSLDGVSGGATDGGIVSADVPTGSAVEQAFLYASTFGNASAPDITFSFEDNDLSLEESDFTQLSEPKTVSDLIGYRADVTDFVAGQIGTGSDERFDFTVSDVDEFNVDGFALAIVYANPADEERTIVFLDGGTDPAGDSFSLDFSEPVDVDAPGFEALLSLGIGYGFQDAILDLSQFSQIDVNGRRLTTAAGGQDDGASFDGGLITIGGLDDDPANPVNPMATPTGPLSDDELYNLAIGSADNPAPFLPDGATGVVVDTLNPSDNDNIFFAGFNVTDVVSVDTEENDPPVAVDDTASTSAAAALGMIDVLANDFDPDGDAIVVSSFDDTGTAGMVTDNGDGTFAYDPNGAFDSLEGGDSATDSFAYTISDGEFTDEGTVTVTVNGVPDDGGDNLPPVAAPDLLTTDEDTPVATFDVLSNDTDPDGDPLTVDSFDATGLQGILTPLGNGQFSYDPAGAFEDLDDGGVATTGFTYTISDGNGGTTTGVVEITIDGVTDAIDTNDAPIAAPDLFSTDEDTAILGIDLLANDFDPDGDPLTLVSVDATATQGLVIDNGDGTFTYDPNGQFDSLNDGEIAVDGFTYVVSDGELSTVGFVEIAIAGVGQPPAGPLFEYSLYDTAADTVFATITDGAVIDVTTLEAGLRSIAADFIGDGTAGDDDGSIQFSLLDPDGINRFATENIPVYSITGGDTDILDPESPLTDGAYILRVDAFAGDDATGTQLATETISFTLASNMPSAFTFSVFDTGADSEVTTFEDGDAINVTDLDAALRGITADYIGDGTAGDDDGSILFSLTGPDGIALSATENLPIFSLTGGDTDILDPSVPLVDGAYSLIVQAFSGNKGTGDLLAEETVDFTFVTDAPPAFAYNVLDTDNDTVFSALEDGDVINVTDLDAAFRGFSADYIGDGTAGDDDGSIRLSLTGPDGIALGKVEDQQVFSLTGGDTDFRDPAVPLVDGDYTLTVEAFSGNGTSGELLEEETISFTLVSDEPPAFTYTLFNTATDTAVTGFEDGDTVGVGTLDATLRSISADYIGDGVEGDDDGSILFALSGPDGLTLSATENLPFFSLTGGDTDIRDPIEALVDGDYTLTVQAYSGNRGMGDLLAEDTIDFTLHGIDGPTVQPVAPLAASIAPADGVAPPDVLEEFGEIDVAAGLTDPDDLMLDVA